MKLTGLEVENVKRISAVKLDLNGVDVVKVRGENEQGKSSLLDAVQYLFGGAKTHPPDVIRKGEKTAKVVGETPELIATRHWWLDDNGAVKTELEVRAKGDAKAMKGPQAVLDKLYAESAAAPEAFAELPADRQLALMKKITGVDTDAIDREYADLFAKRTTEKRELALWEAKLETMPKTAPPPAVHIADVQAALNGERATLTTLEARRAARDTAFKLKGAADQAVLLAERALADAHARQAKAAEEWGKADNAVDDALEAADGAEERIAALDGQIHAATKIALEHMAWDEKLQTERAISTRAESIKATSGRLGDLEAKKGAMVAAAKFPIAGLGFGSGGITFNGLPFEQASAAARLRVSVAVAVALNPKLKVLLVRNGSLLDTKSIKLLAELAVENDYQIFMELVGEEGPATVVIRDGEALAPEVTR